MFSLSPYILHSFRQIIHILLLLGRSVFRESRKGFICPNLTLIVEDNTQSYEVESQKRTILGSQSYYGIVINVHSCHPRWMCDAYTEQRTAS